MIMIRAGTVALFLLAVTVPVSCVDWMPRPPRPPVFPGLTHQALPIGGRATINIGFPSSLRTAANPAYTANDVTQVEIRLYSRNVAHATYDYQTDGQAWFTSSGYTWADGVDQSGNRQYTISNLPVSATPYIVTGRAFTADRTNVTKVDVNGFPYARSSNDVTIGDTETTYSGPPGTDSLQVTIPLLDLLGGEIDMETTFSNGSNTPGLVGRDS